MIKVNEIKMMEMINNNDIFGIQRYIENEIIVQKTIDKSDIKKIKAFKNLAKKTYKDKKDLQPVLAGAYEIDKKAVICDSYKVAWINKSLDELGDVIRVETDDIMQVEKFFVEEYSNHTEVEFCSKQFLIQYAEYKSIPAKEREEHESRFFEIKIKDVSIWFDIEFIKDMDDIFNLSESKLYASNLSESKLYASNPEQALFIESNFGKGLIMPIYRRR